MAKFLRRISARIWQCYCSKNTMKHQTPLVRIRCSVYIINSLLAANCMCSWAPYLIDCKPRLIKFYSSFHEAYKQGRLKFCIFLLYRKAQMTLSHCLAAFCRPNSSFAFDFLQHHVNILHKRDYDKQKAVVVV